MTSKERAQLRAQANTLDPLFQIGKGGISDTLIRQTEDALRANELIKLKVHLDTAPEKPKEFAQKLSEATNSESVQVIGGCIVLYKYNPELHKKKPVEKKSPAKKYDGNKIKTISKKKTFKGNGKKSDGKDRNSGRNV